MFDVLVGVNLLREGLDLPEVSLVAILDADKEGFLRSETSLVQTIGRGGTQRRRHRHPVRRLHHALHAAGHGRDPAPPGKAGRLQQSPRHRPQDGEKGGAELMALSADEKPDYNDKNLSQMTKLQRMEAIASLEKQMKEAAKMLEFEVAAALRDQIIKLRGK